jgi:hypothetical protein
MCTALLIHFEPAQQGARRTDCLTAPALAGFSFSVMHFFNKNLKPPAFQPASDDPKDA